MLSRSRKLLYLLATFLTLVVLAELGARTLALATGRGFQENPDFAFTSPFFTTSWPPQPHMEGNQLTFHGDILPFQKATNEIRVLCFGGSTTVNQRSGASYAALLEERLDPEFPDHQIRVVRAASHAYTTAHSLVNLSLRCLEALPDVITVYHAANDASVHDHGDRVEPDYANKYMSPMFLSYHHRTGFWSGVTKVSRLARYLEKNVMGVAHGLQQRDPGPDLPGVEYFQRNLRSIVAVARAHGVRVVLATQAGRSDTRIGSRFGVYNEAVRRVAEELGVPCVDAATQVLDDACFVDRLHYTRIGLEAVADAFEPVLRDQVAAVAAGERAMEPRPGPHQR